MIEDEDCDSYTAEDSDEVHALCPGSCCEFAQATGGGRCDRATLRDAWTGPVGQTTAFV